MSKRLLLSVIVVLIIMNIATLLFWNKDGNTSEIRVNNKEQVALINGEEITRGELFDSLKNNYEKHHLKTMIDRIVVKQLADQKDVNINEKVIEREIALLKTMQGILTEEELVEKEKQWREDIMYRYQLEALLAEGSNIPEEETRTFFNEYHKQYDFMESMQYSHIVVEDIDKAEKVISEIENGASFNLLAKEYSIDEETKNAGGYLGFFVKTNPFLPKAYYETASKMAENSYSEPIQTNKGIAIIYLHQHIPSITFTYDEIKSHIKNELALNKSEQSLTAEPLWNKLDIEWVYEE